MLLLSSHGGGPSMGWLTQLVGIGIVILALVDIYYTVLYFSSYGGILSTPLNKGVWQLFRFAAVVIPFGRNRLLSYNGPTLLVTTVVLWVGLLMGGFALIAWPALGSGIQASQGPTPTDFVTALYYSGYALTTLGTGDIGAKTGFYRLVMIFETVVGLSSLTLVLTYFQSVYSALIRRNTFALSLLHRTASTGDAAELLARLGARGDFSGARQDIADMAKDLANLLESDHTYPILHYFRFQEAHYALPRMLLVAMDTVSLIRSALDTEKYASLVYSASLAELEGSGLALLMELTNSFLPRNFPGIEGQPESVWRQRYYDAVERLEAEGIEIAPDIEAGADLYVFLRRKWGFSIIKLATYLEYEWSEVAPAESYLPVSTPDGG